MSTKTCVSLCLQAQWFSQNPLNRSFGQKVKAANFFRESLVEGRGVLVKARDVSITSGSLTSDAGIQLAWVDLDQASLARCGLRINSEGGAENKDGSSPKVAWSDQPALVDAYFLGRDEHAGKFAFALDLTAVAEEDGPITTALQTQGVEFLGLRALMYRCTTAGTVAMAGQAAALVGWHRKARFCGVCGSPTVPIEAGLKRACSQEKGPCRNRLYPRTDPCVNMLVESADGKRCLLGRRRGMSKFWSNLAGFVEQGESVEEAARREVREESGILVGPVVTAGTQPWPPGTAGSCELMIGVYAKALSNEVLVDPEEMGDARWFDRETVREALERSISPDNPIYKYSADAAVPDSQEELLWVPGPYAIAYHLLKAWVEEAPIFGATGDSRM